MTELAGKCWEWQKGCNSSGYGHLRWKGKMQLAHRLSYKLLVAEIPENMCVLHKCDNRKCINPKHLWLGTKGDNNRDCIQKGRANKSRGEKNGWSKLAKEQVLEILESNETHRALGKKFNVTHATIGYIKRGKYWKHIGENYND